jgi:hypothetical protein
MGRFTEYPAASLLATGNGRAQEASDGSRELITPSAAIERPTS